MLERILVSSVVLAVTGPAVVSLIWDVARPGLAALVGVLR